jgi:phage shock protein PspC (stress-responsive transcriptional regulator)
MYCTACGSPINEEHNFCPKCGMALGRQSADGAPPPAPHQKRLVRLMREKSIGGVCVGFARYMDVDVTLMRIIWLCGAIFTGIGFIAYLVCWIVMPADWGAETQPAAPATEEQMVVAEEPPAEAPKEETGPSPA